MRSCFLLLACAAAAAQTTEKPVRSVTDPGVITTRQMITPAGVPAIFQGRVYGVTFGLDGKELWVLGATHLYRMDWQANRVLERIPVGGSPGLQSIAFDGERKQALFAATRKGAVRLVTSAGSETAGSLGSFIAGAIQTNGRLAVAPLIYNNELAVVDLADGRLKGKVRTGIAPFGAAMDAAGKTAYVTNWGGRPPLPRDLTAPTGLKPDADRVVIDARGVASTGTVTRIDLETLAATHTIPVELHPTAVVWDESRARVYVANTNSDSISILDSKTNRLIRSLPLQPFPVKVSGLAPTALALSRDGARLYAACGGINAVLSIETATGRVEGAIPTAWYPNALALSPDGKRLAMASLLGPGSGWRDEPSKRYVHANRGSVNVVDIPDAPQLASYTTAVAENNRLTLAPAARRQPGARPKAVPERAGDPSLIEHVVFIIKENRTYDQVFGDLEKGNGDPSLVLFGAAVTPNHRRLAEQFVLLDNFYATGGNSGDGHQWLTQANETAYCLWPGYQGRSYPFDGTDPIAYSSTGFLWDLALAAKRTVRVYGEFAPRLPEPRQLRGPLLDRWRKGETFESEWKVSSPIPSLNKVLVPNYPTYTNSIPDVVRARIFLADLKKWEASGGMPNLTIVQLPCDHTFGATPEVSTPKAMVADNDLAMGQIVEALTRSRFWPKMAIFIVEDDAQNGVDHVDGHRTVALAASPYVRRGHLDSTFYSHQSMLKTIELMLGLPTLSLFDLIANDMRASFQDTPDLTPYQAVVPEQSLDELNPPLKALHGEARRAALDSQRMNFDVPDAAPTERLNRIVWHSLRGWNVPYPAPKRAVFAPLSLDLDDEER
ncbi:MAG: bifunctional YncE family protein/alkaline phosphatase family protein [Bryobacterales bacterium]|nr:bifunctional YncE family protein/alkaline phosphatase family protein [Bryobacterales bacterium]